MKLQKIYTLEYSIHGNRWRIKVVAFSIEEARQNASKACFVPALKFKKVAQELLFHSTFGAERAPQ